ncbi:MAG: DUF4249 domain-containing protein [Bacteroidetes bacterium]|nr:DUF4249 domain-containing protein [Bacteroidota bacterium]
MKTLCALCLFFFLFSCEKAINIKLDNVQPHLVVEATIENDKTPVVVLTKSLDYFSQISNEILANSFVHDAIINISDGSTQVQLKEYSTPLPASGYTLYYYGVDSSNLSQFIGKLDQAYTLKIQVDNEVYTAQTTIPKLAKKIDSLWWKSAPNNPDTTKIVVKARVVDPPGLGNYIRYFTRVGNAQFFPGLNSVFDDQIVDGTTYDVDVDRGVNRNEKINFDTYAFFERGDTVTIKFCNIDKATFDFWRTTEYNYQSVGNPFSTPTQVISNISNNALGYFGGYAAQYKTIIIPK